MSKREVTKKRSARLAYNLGFGSKRHFATYDIVEKVPAYFGVMTFAAGIIFLKYQNTPLADGVGVLTSILGFAIFYLNFYSNDKNNYVEVGKKITSLYNATHRVYEKSLNCTEAELDLLNDELDKIDDEFQIIAIHKQVFLSNELAHFKLFWESQSDWFSEELELKFLKDKIPAVWRIYFFIIIVCSILMLLLNSGLFFKLMGCFHVG